MAGGYVIFTWPLAFCQIVKITSSIMTMVSIIIQYYKGGFSYGRHEMVR